MASAEPIRSKKQLKKMFEYYLQKGEIRNYLLMLMGVHTALRISDLLSLRWRDVYNFKCKCFLKHLYVTEKKTGKDKLIALHKNLLKVLKMHFETSKRNQAEDFIFDNNRAKAAPLSRVHAYRIIKSAASYTNTSGNISCHSLRKTFGYYAWKSRVPSALLMDIYNHTSFEVTRVYLGISQDDKDEVYLNLTI